MPNSRISFCWRVRKNTDFWVVQNLYSVQIDLYLHPLYSSSHQVTWISSDSVQFSSVAQSCPTLCDPMNRSTPGLHVHHQLLVSTQTHVHQVSDAIQPFHPLSSPSPAVIKHCWIQFWYTLTSALTRCKNVNSLESENNHSLHVFLKIII